MVSKFDFTKFGIGNSGVIASTFLKNKDSEVNRLLDKPSMHG